MRQLTRRLLPLVLVGALVGAGALLAGRPGAAGTPDRLVALRVAAALTPCPAGLGPAFPAARLGCLAGGPSVNLPGPVDRTPRLVNIWATWCPPCVAEVPLLVAFQARAGHRLQVVGVLTTDEPSDALTFAAQTRLHYPVLDDRDGQVKRRFVSALPGTLFVDAAGRVAYVQRGPFSSASQLAELTARYLGVTV